MQLCCLFGFPVDTLKYDRYTEISEPRIVVPDLPKNPEWSQYWVGQEGWSSSRLYLLLKGKHRAEDLK